MGERGHRSESTGVGAADQPTGRCNPARSELTLHRQLELEPGPPRSTLNEPLLTPHDAATLLAVRVSWIYDAVRAGRLPCVRVGRHVRFLRTDLERWIADQRG